MLAEPDLAARVDGSPALRRRQTMGRLVVRLLGRAEIVGVERIPDTGPVLLAINHRSMLDGPLIFGFVHRPVTCLVKTEAFLPVIGAVLRSCGQLPVVRERPDPVAVRACLRVLRAGGVVGIFPEGSRGDGTCRTARPGVGYLALRSGATVLPVACHGTRELGRRLRPRVRLTVGRPLPFERYPDGRPLNRKLAASATEEIRAELAALVRAAAPSSRERVAA